MVQPLISCIVPAYNGQRYIDATVSSIFAQSYRPLQVLVVDDGSSDRTAQVVGSLDHPIEVIRQANAGPAAACNRGLEAAKGELVAFLEQDDLWHPQKLSRQWARLQSRPELDYSVTLIRNFRDGQDPNSDHGGSEHGPKGMTPVPGYLCQTLLARRSTFEKVGGFDTRFRYSHATEWFARAQDRGAHGELLDEVLVFRRLHDDNTSLVNDDASRAEYLELVKHVLARRRSQTGG